MVNKFCQLFYTPIQYIHPSIKQQMAEQFKYPQCQRGKQHSGELLNLVCLESSCSHQSIICDFCYAQAHEGHKIKPLKVLLNNAKKYLLSKEPPNVSKLKEILLHQQKKLTLILNQFEETVHAHIREIFNQAKNIYPMLSQQVLRKSGFEDKQLIETLQHLKNNELPYDVFNSFMQTLLQEMPTENQKVKTNTTPSIGQMAKIVSDFSSQLQSNFEEQSKKIDGQFTNLKNYFEQIRNRPDILQAHSNYDFSKEFKHDQIAIVSPKLARSIGTDSYRFALLAPPIPQLSTSLKVQFLIKKKVSEWVAVGVCYKQRVKKSNYTFDYITPNHGGYLLSSNGGAWTEIDSSINGTFWGFKFAEKDRIVVHYDPMEKKIHFLNVRTQEKRSLVYYVKPEEKLHFCALFYFNQDEIEFLGEYRQ